MVGKRLGPWHGVDHCLVPGRLCAPKPSMEFNRSGDLRRSTTSSSPGRIVSARPPNGPSARRRHASRPARHLLAAGGSTEIDAESKGKGSGGKRRRRAKPASIVAGQPPVAISGRRRRRPAAALVAAAAVWLPRMAEAQYNADTPLFEETMERAEAELTASLKGGDYVEDVFFPERQVRSLNKNSRKRMPPSSPPTRLYVHHRARESTTVFTAANPWYSELNPTKSTSLASERFPF